jgi:nitrogen regulatory protein PII-like uncharacterized protein
MKHIKKYKHKPEIGDYVLCSENDKSNDDLNIFIDNNIGKIINIISATKNTMEYYYVVYNKVPANIDGIFVNDGRNMWLSEIKYWSKDKEELEAILQVNKYNL